MLMKADRTIIEVELYKSIEIKDSQLEAWTLGATLTNGTSSESNLIKTLRTIRAIGNMRMRDGISKITEEATKVIKTEILIE